MNIAVIGLGSMGKRRVRLLREMYPEYNINGVDGRNDRRIETYDQFGIRCFNKIEDIDEKIDCVFVCTSPLSHAAIIEDALRRGCHVFTELNLVADGYDSNIQLAKEKNLTLFLSSTFLYREEIQFIERQIVGDNWNYIYHIGQYLPDWHPWENYKEFFLGDKRTNGCREILAIELPWLIETFGEVNAVNVLSSKMSGLNIDYDDNFLIQLEHIHGNKGALLVDVVSPVAVRKLEVYKEKEYISWEGTPESLVLYNDKTKKLDRVSLLEKTERVEGYNAFVVENAYKNEIKAFFDAILDGKKPLYDIEKDKRILNMIDSIGA